MNRLVARNVKDVDARLMRATLKRHTGRIDEAREELDSLQRFEASAKWQEEIRLEREALARLQEEATQKPISEAA